MSAANDFIDAFNKLFREEYFLVKTSCMIFNTSSTLLPDNTEYLGGVALSNLATL